MIRRRYKPRATAQETPAARGSGPVLAAAGADDNIYLLLAGKGTGGVRVGAAGQPIGFAGVTPISVP